MLVHMTPNEVQGLQGLAMAHGGSLSINPQTGLPEAGILDFVLPVAGSFFGLDPFIVAGIMGGKSLIEGGDIGSAALSAFGGYTGGKLGKSLKSFVDPIQSLPTSAVNAATNTANTAGSFVGPTGEMGSKLLSQSGGASQIGSNLGSVADEFGVNRPVEDVFKKSFKPDFGKQNFVPGFADNNLEGSPGMFQPFGSEPLRSTGIPTYGPNVGASTDIGSTISQGASDFSNQFNTAVKNPVDFARYVGEGDALAGGAKIGMYAASPLIEGMMKPQTFAYTDPEKGKYKGPQGQLNLSDRFDTGLRLAAKGGYIDGYATGGTIQSGGIRDLYGTPDNQPTISPGLSGFGLGRLNNLAGEQAMTQAQTLGYAEGGDVGMNLDRLPSLNLGSGRQGYSGGSGDILASMDPNDPMVQQFFRPGIEKMRAQYNALYGDGSDNILNTMGPNDPIMQKFLRPGIEKMRAQNKALYGDGPDSILNTIDRNDPIAQKMLIPGIEKIRAQNKAVFGYVKGGYLDGQGDGMSDSIPATIEGKQPARLADGEFVVPADVVSHIGNGSSKAGSKRLYAMLDKVRKARTGHTKQGKQIKADKYLPA
jgi:hypothetical protein